MNIGIVLRAYDRFGGIGIYSKNITKHLLKIDNYNHYILIYNNRNHIGSFKNFENVSEISIPSGNTLLWDQWKLVESLKGQHVDLIFNTKFTVPIFTRSKTVMALHGSSWYTNPEFYNKFDILYVHAMMPIYCHKADFLISNSDLTTFDYIKYLHIESTKISTVRLAAGEEFVPIVEQQTLNNIKDKYNLPDNFILTVTSYENKRKNFITLLKAFENCRKELNDIELVVVGKDCYKYINDFRLNEKGLLKYIHFTGWIDQKDLPVIYSLAKIYAFPSVYEEFGIPILEAMSCGCPVVASNTGAIPELAEGAGSLCDPFNVKQFSDGICSILTSKEVERNCQK